MRGSVVINSVKALIRSVEGRYLILTFNQHPYFGNDIDLPGGEFDEEEDLYQAIAREVYEETGLNVKNSDISIRASTRKYSRSGNLYNLMEIELDRPVSIKLSQEHIDYEWLEVDEVIERSAQSKNGYLHLAADVIAGKIHH